MKRTEGREENARREKETVGIRPPQTSYRLGKEHKISITRLPFHQTGTYSSPPAACRIYRGSHHVTSNERRTMDETTYRATSSFFPSQPFFFVDFENRTENIRRTDKSIFSFSSHTQFP